MCLLGYIIIGITVGIDGPIELLKSHQSSYELVIGVEQTSKPLLGFDVIDLPD